ncbi:MAG: MFS transporter [Acidobacteriota bacterium]|nr:MFS transporter [Acidobacteriota bacterium]
MMQNLPHVPDLESTTLAKVRWRLIPFLFLLYVIAYLDRVNVGYAALDMNRDLGFSAAVYGFGSGIFFLSYTLLEVPSNLILARVGARRWIARIMITWGLVSMAMMFVTTPLSFYVLRFVLGAAEAGFFPGLILYLTHWFPARERARAVALFMTATAMAGVIGAPISSALLQLDGLGGLHGWQWLFIIEGLPAVLLAPVVLRRLTERPADATWLNADEREWLSNEMAKEHAQTDHVHLTLRAAASSGRLWALSALYCCIVMAFYGISFWLPQIVQATGGLSSARVILLTAIPYVAATIGLVVIGSRSDRKVERRWHVAVPCLIGAGGFVLTVLAPPSAAMSLAMLSIAAFGIWGTLGPFWAMPTAFLRGTAAAGGIAIVNSIGNIGGFAGPFAIGWVRDATGSFEGGLLALAGVLVVGAAIAISLPATDSHRLATDANAGR